MLINSVQQIFYISNKLIKLEQIISLKIKLIKLEQIISPEIKLIPFINKFYSIQQITLNKYSHKCKVLIKQILVQLNNIKKKLLKYLIITNKSEFNCCTNVL